MARSRNGEHRHRQTWRPVICPECGQEVPAIPTGPGRPWHLRAHFVADDDGDLSLCPAVVYEVASPH